MKFNWLATTAVALVIGSGAVVAQTQSDQKREEGPHAQAPASKDQKAKERRGEAASPAERKQAQEQKDTKQPTKQSQDTQQRHEPSSAAAQQSPEHAAQNQEQQKAHDTKQANQPKPKHDNQARDTKQPEQKNQARDSKQPEHKNQARDTKQPSDTKQQSQQQPATNQAAQPSTSPTQPSTSTAQQPSTSTKQQTAQPGSTTRQGQTAGQTNDPNRPGSSTSVTANDPQRTQISDRLRRDQKDFKNQSINISVSVGERLPPRVRLRPLPRDIVRIDPRYRGYDYTIVEDQVYIVEPRTKKVVDIISEPGASRTSSTTTFRSERINLTTEQRETLKQSAHRMSSATVAATPSGGTSADSSCLTLQPVPDELTRANPELGQYRMLAIGDQVVLIDPRQQKVVDVVE